MGLRNKLKKAAMTGAALFGASKLMGKKETSRFSSKNIKNLKDRKGAPQDLAESTKRPSNLTKDMGLNRKVGDVKTVKPRKNEKSIYVNDDGSIQRGDKLYKDRITYRNRNKSTGDKKQQPGRGDKNNQALKKTTNIFGGKTKEQRAADKEARKARIKKFQEDKKKQIGRGDKNKAYLGLSKNSKGGMPKYNLGGIAVSGKGQGAVLAGKNKKTIIY